MNYDFYLQSFMRPIFNIIWKSVIVIPLLHENKEDKTVAPLPK